MEIKKDFDNFQLEINMFSDEAWTTSELLCLLESKGLINNNGLWSNWRIAAILSDEVGENLGLSSALT